MKLKTAKCPACLLRFEIDNDDLVQCPSCASLLRLARWEPPTLELLEIGPDGESVEEEEDRARYEEEMAKITYHELESGCGAVSEVDISEPARALRFIRLLDYLLIYICSIELLDILSFFVYMPEVRQGLPLFVSMVLAGIFLFCMRIGHRHLGVIDERVWGKYLLALPLLVLVYSLAIVAYIRIITGPANAAAYVTKEAALFNAAWGSFYLFLAAAGIVVVVLLRRMRVPGLGLRLTRLLSELRSCAQSLAPDAPPPRKLNKPRGLLIAGAGIALILSSAFEPPTVTLTDILRFNFIFMYVRLGGWALLLMSRRYFQVDADSLLAVDPRRPILFLRSFDDDKRLSYRDAIMQVLDFSLETRLSNHFTRFGPFIAVGTPGETVPVPGAARVVMSNQEWLPRVTDWMAASRLIVMYAGRTNWVNWEMAKVIETGRMPDLILIIPEVSGRKRAVRAENISPRIERLGEVIKGTRWEDSFVKISDVQDVRAMLFRADGSVVVIRSRPRNRDSYHLAVLLAHHLTFERAAAAAPGQIAEPVGEYSPA